MNGITSILAPKVVQAGQGSDSPEMLASMIAFGIVSGNGASQAVIDAVAKVTANAAQSENPTMWLGAFLIDLGNQFRNLLLRVADLEAAGGGGGGSGSAPVVDLTITGYTGGGATKLDGYDESLLSVGQIIIMKHATTGPHGFVYRLGSDAESSPDVGGVIVRPDTFTNKVYELIF